MKKLLLISLLGATITNIAHAEITDASNVTSYVGADYTLLSNDGTTVSFLGATAGLQFNEFIGAEAFWSKNVSQPYDDSHLNAENYGMGLTGKYTFASNLYAKGLVGFSKMSLNQKDSDGTEKASDTGFLAKAGLGYNFNKNVATEVNYIYQGMFSNFNGVNVEIKYTF